MILILVTLCNDEKLDLEKKKIKNQKLAQILMTQSYAVVLLKWSWEVIL